MSFFHTYFLESHTLIDSPDLIFPRSSSIHVRRVTLWYLHIRIAFTARSLIALRFNYSHFLMHHAASQMLHFVSGFYSVHHYETAFYKGVFIMDYKISSTYSLYYSALNFKCSTRDGSCWIICFLLNNKFPFYQEN